MKIFVVAKDIDYFRSFVLQQPRAMRKYYYYLTESRQLRGHIPLLVVYDVSSAYLENEFLDEIEMIMKYQEDINDSYFKKMNKERNKK